MNTKLENIMVLCKELHNDMDLGKAVRQLMSNTTEESLQERLKRLSVGVYGKRLNNPQAFVTHIITNAKREHVELMYKLSDEDLELVLKSED